MNENFDVDTITPIIEVCLLTATEPLSVEQLALAFDNNVDHALIKKIIFNLSVKYTNSGLELLHLKNGYRFRSKIEYQSYLNKIYNIKPLKYSQAIMETIAIITYKQPITRGEIENIRGVTLGGNIISTLLERQWIEVVGTKEVPGRPELLATTDTFLNDLGITSLQELPNVEHLIEKQIDN